MVRKKLIFGSKAIEKEWNRLAKKHFGKPFRELTKSEERSIIGRSRMDFDNIFKSIIGINKRKRK